MIYCSANAVYQRRKKHSVTLINMFFNYFGGNSGDCGELAIPHTALVRRIIVFYLRDLLPVKIATTKKNIFLNASMSIILHPFIFSHGACHLRYKKSIFFIAAWKAVLMQCFTLVSTC